MPIDASERVTALLKRFHAEIEHILMHINI